MILISLLDMQIIKVETIVAQTCIKKSLIDKILLSKEIITYLKEVVILRVNKKSRSAETHTTNVKRK